MIKKHYLSLKATQTVQEEINGYQIINIVYYTEF